MGTKKPMTASQMGLKRMAKLTKAQRQELARYAALTRWSKRKAKS